MPPKGSKKPSLKEVLDREEQPDYHTYNLSEYSDSDSGYENLLDPNEAMVTNYVAQTPVKQKKEKVPTSKKIQKIPPIWLRNCPLQKIQQNIKMIIDYQDKQKYPKIFPLKNQPPLRFINQKEKELFLFRVETANQYITDEQSKARFKKCFDEVPPDIRHEKRTVEEISKWRVTMQTILVQTCRKLEEFLKKYLGLNTIPLTRIQYREVHNMLLNLSLTFEPDFCQSFLNFVKLTYRLPSITLSRVQQVTKLYKTIQIAAKAKIRMRLQAISRSRKSDIKLQSFTQLTVKTKLKSIWNYEFEKIMINAYRRNQNFGYIKEQFQNEYPQHRGCFTANQIKDRFHSLIRAALRIVRGRLKEHSAHGEVPKLFGLNEKRFKIISKSRLAIHLRLWLLELYKKDNYKIEQILDMVDMMNEFVYTKQNSQDTSSIATTSLAGSRVSNFTFSEEESTFKLEEGREFENQREKMRSKSRFDEGDSTEQSKQSIMRNGQYFWGEQSDVEKQESQFNE